ncbi:MAG: ABC transporter permease [Clostridia bacterium]|nr:ABC transporter permease [Clostridia bacterium]
MKNTLFSPMHKRYVKKLKRNKIVITCAQIGVLVVFLCLWELLAQVGFIDAFLMSSPTRIWRTLADLYLNGQLFYHVWVSLFETLLGFLIGTVGGTAIAVVLWWSKPLRDVLQPYIVVLNSLPKIALGPIIIVWAGTGQKAIVTMAVLISIIVTIITMLGGFLQTSPEKILLLESMNANKMQIFFKLVFPANLSTLASCLKINVGMAWIGSIMGEYLVSKAGLGYLIVYGGQVFKMDLVMACTIVLCLLAGVMYFLVALLEKFFVKWKS